MAIVLESATETRADLEAAMRANGVEPEPETTQEEKPAATQAAPSGEPGGKPPAEPEGKPAQEAEPDNKTQKQEAHGTEQSTETTPAKPKAKGGFQAKLEKKTRENDFLREEVERLRAQLEEGVTATPASGATEEEPTQETAPVELKKPTRPEMPDLSDFDYDQDKYKEAMQKYRKDLAKYDDDLDTYHAQRQEQITQQAIAKEKETQQQQAMESARQQVWYDYKKRVDADAEFYPDLEDKRAAVGERDLKFGEAATDYILRKSKHPAALADFFFDDVLENGSAELERIEGLSAAEQVLELKDLEDRLVKERSKPAGGEQGEQKAPPPPAPKPAAAAPKAPPAETTPPVRKETPEPPLRTVGGHATPVGDFNSRLQAAAERGDSPAYRAILKEMQAAKAGGSRR